MSFKTHIKNPDLISQLDKLGYQEAKPIQTLTLEADSTHLWLSAPTGTGKTLAYTLKALQNHNPQLNHTLQTLIITPSHELCMQISEMINSLIKPLGMSALGIIGKASIERQKEKLKKNKPIFIVGTTGRILELLQQNKIKLSHCINLVIDEADKMLTTEQLGEVKKLLTHFKTPPRMIYASATAKDNAITVAETLSSPLSIITDDQTKLDIKHHYIIADNNRKTDCARKIIHAINPNNAILFLHRNSNVDFIAKKLDFTGLELCSIHGQKDKLARQKAIQQFSRGIAKILIASDIAARGLDISNATTVINYDLPSSIEDYQHRSGRIGRNGQSGTVINIISPHEMRLIEKYQRHLNIDITPIKTAHGNIAVINSENRK